MMAVSICHITTGIPHLSTFILLPSALTVMLDKDYLNLVLVRVTSLYKLFWKLDRGSQAPSKPGRWSRILN